MRVTIIRDDGVVGINGVFRKVTVSDLPEGVRAVQWDGSNGHIEYDNMANSPLTGISTFQAFIDRWTAAAPQPSATASQRLITATHMRINAAYETAVQALTSGYPQNEIASWPKQEAEARAWVANNSASTPWIDGAAAARGVSKAELAAKIIAQADALAPLHGSLTGKRQMLRDQIDALGPNASAEQLNAIQWK